MEERSMGESIVNLATFVAVNKYKSIRRAMRRGLVAWDGTLYPRRPFNCRKPTRGRKFNEDKKKIYAELNRYSRVS